MKTDNFKIEIDKIELDEIDAVEICVEEEEKDIHLEKVTNSKLNQCFSER